MSELNGDENLEEFIVDEADLERAEERIPETIFELETLTGITREKPDVRRQKLRELWDIATLIDIPLPDSLGIDYCYANIITVGELEQFFNRMTPRKERISSEDSPE